MIFKIFLFVFPLLIIMNSALAPYNLDDNWKFRRISHSNEINNEWYQAQVPGFIHLDLLRNNLIPDPFYRDNEPKVQWIETVDWEYQREFNVSQAILSSKIVEIQFEGLDTHATVYLNGNLILKANNYFRSWAINVKEYLKAEDNLISIVFKSAVNYDNEMKANFSPIIVPADNPSRTPFSRKPRYHYGWDWGPRLVTCGIHKPINLVGYDIAKLKNFNLETLEIIKQNDSSNSAIIRAEAYVEREKTAQKVNFQLIFWESKEKKHILEMGSLELEENQTLIHYKKNFTLNNIELWWSRGLGNAKLYEFSFELYDPLNKLVDKSERKFGIRKVKLMQIPDKDENGTSFFIQLNGKDVFIKGANYIPPDSFATRVTKEKHDELIKSMIDGNYNGMRIWGGGYFETLYFYDKCDENGLLIFQDFMFACEMYPGTEEYMLNYREEFIENVLNLKTHPSIVLWIGNNEVNEAWHNWGFTTNLTQNNIDTVWNWYLSIFEGLFPKLVSEFDSQRPYWPSSPLYGYGHPESLLFGDSHFWLVWAAGEPIATYKNHVGRFMTEYGMQGILDINSVKVFTLPQDRFLNSSVIRNHEKHAKGFENLQQYINETHGILPDDFEDYIYLSQIMQAYAIETAVTTHRVNKPYCMGTLYWQINDAWPALSWASVDYYGHWKALHYAAKQFNQDLIMLGKENTANNQIEIRVLSELGVDKFVDLEIYEYNMKGDLIYKEIKSNYLAKELSNEIVKTFEFNDKQRSNIFFDLRIVEKEGNNVWEYLYFMKEPKFLELTQSDEIEIFYDRQKHLIVVYSEYLVKNLYIYDEDQYLKLENNYFDLLPRQKKVIRILNSEEISKGRDLRIKFKSYNGILQKYPRCKEQFRKSLIAQKIN